MSSAAYLLSEPHAWTPPEIVRTPIEHHMLSTHTLPSLDYVTGGIVPPKPLATSQDHWTLHKHQHQHQHQQQYQVSPLYGDEESLWHVHQQTVYYDRYQAPPSLHRTDDSTYSSDCSSDRHMSNAGSPLLHTLSQSPMPVYHDHTLTATSLYGFGLDPEYFEPRYINPDAVQLFNDAQSHEAVEETAMFDGLHQPQEGFMAMQPPFEQEDAPAPTLMSAHTPPLPLPPLRSSNTRRQRRDNRSDSAYPRQPAANRRRSIASRAPTFSMRTNAPTPRPFPCPLAPYGCTSAFTAKNEWKRHVYKQHLRTAVWRCKLCTRDDTRGDNEFNRKDLFVQHVKRMHMPKSLSKTTTGNKKRTPIKSIKREEGSAADLDLDDLAEKCCHTLRGLPEKTCCLFCESEFEGRGSFEERLEHVGRHLTEMKLGSATSVPVENYRRDEGMEAWLCQSELAESRGGRVRLFATGR